MHLDWSDEEPEELDVNDLASIIVPSLKAITRLNDTFGQAWFDGKQSLKDMRTGGETRRYPLWVNTYFHNMRQACRISDKWCAGIGLVTQNTINQRRVVSQRHSLCLLGDSEVLGWRDSWPLQQSQA